ncbi:MAG TPA: Flp family type IVb pilin [Actinomycetota bacterium]|nr:Flp family type IVb pilin [Actinomycetota bacterium]
MSALITTMHYRTLAAILAHRLRSDERGSTAVEYGLIIVLIAATVLTAVAYFGQSTSGALNCTAASVQARADSC